MSDFKQNVIAETDFMQFGKCNEGNNSKLFGDRESKAAKAVCDLCEVEAECLDYALRNHILTGIWGGTGEKDRKAMWDAQGEEPTEP
jgi:WhiB family redox-sensing transcriptional regulator